MEHTEKFASVITDLAIDKTLDYAIPSSLLSQIKKGVHVKVAVRGIERHAIVHSVKETCEFKNVLPIKEVLSQGELVPEDLFELALWMSTYYAAALFKILKVMLPTVVRQTMSHKEQFYVMRAKTKEALRIAVTEMRSESEAQSKVLDAMLMAKKGMLLTELLEKAAVSRSPVDSLVKKGLLLLETVRLDRSPIVGEEYFKTQPKQLTEEQHLSLQRITGSLEKGVFESHLLFGVTGSGKTEVYLQAIEKALALGKSTIMLVPEISLTAQTIERFQSRFESKLAILHHRLSNGERYDEWHRIRRNEAQIVIGARSALFSPVQNLGLIIVDEEHDNAYKQSEETPCYHARDVAVMRCKLKGATVVLGSATPSLETFHNCEKSKYTLSVLKTRAKSAKLPKITLVDMKKEQEKNRGFVLFSQPLIEGLKNRITQGEQAILFLNRRGYHTSYNCLSCGYVHKCPKCDISLTFHLGENTLACHLCDYRLFPPPRRCPQCKSEEAQKYKGVGTELVEKSLRALFPECRTLRIDGDTTKHKGSHETFFRAFSTGKADVLIGTQMIAKGLHFPAVTLVAILNADASLQIPDFRASEHTFQLITQVAGRSGRGHLEGEVIIQTSMPENPLIRLAATGDFENFYKEEMAIRKTFHYPPYTRFVKCLFTGAHLQEVQKIAAEFRSQLAKALGTSCLVHPLLPAGHPKINEIYRLQFLIRGKAIYPIVEKLKKLQGEFQVPRSVKVTLDIDPLSTFF